MKPSGLFHLKGVDPVRTLFDLVVCAILPCFFVLNRSGQTCIHSRYLHMSYTQNIRSLRVNTYAANVKKAKTMQYLAIFTDFISFIQVWRVYMTMYVQLITMTQSYWLKYTLKSLRNIIQLSSGTLWFWGNILPLWDLLLLAIWGGIPLVFFIFNLWGLYCCCVINYI